MIGQKNLIKNINKLFSEEVTPHFTHFILLSGDRGSGRKLVASTVAQKLNGHSIKCGISAEELRNVVDLINRTTDRIVVIIPDADMMSVSAKNVLLKITEETPENAVFIMSVEDEYSMPDTIRSRATLLRMDAYSPDELYEFARSKSEYLTPEELDIIVNICRTPGEVLNLINFGVIEFWEYLLLIVLRSLRK